MLSIAPHASYVDQQTTGMLGDLPRAWFNHIADMLALPSQKLYRITKLAYHNIHIAHSALWILNAFLMGYRNAERWQSNATRFFDLSGLVLTHHATRFATIELYYCCHLGFSSAGRCTCTCPHCCELYSQYFWEPNIFGDLCTSVIDHVTSFHQIIF
jgi:hypothetical protein